MITLTKEAIMNAVDYIPIERKHIWCRNVASACVVKVTVTGNGADNNLFTLPERWEENTMARQMAMASALAQNYLGIYSEDEVLQAKDYDEIMGSHLINQLERMKSDRDVRDKVFNIMYDFNELKKMLNTDIYSRLGHLNDTLSRALAAMQMVRPESMQELQDQINEISTAVSDYEKKKAGRIAGDVAKAARKKKDKPAEETPEKTAKSE